MPMLRQLTHPSRHRCRILCYMVQKALQVRGHKNVHGRRGRFVERAAGVVNTRGEKVRENVVFIGRADQLFHRQAHTFGVITRKDIAEIACGHTEADGRARCDIPPLRKLRIAVKIVNDLRYKAAPVDGVCAGKLFVFGSQLLREVLVRKHALYTCLRVVEVSVDSIHRHVISLLRGHLQALHLTGARVGIKHRDTDARQARIARERGLSRIAGGRYKDLCHACFSQIFFGLYQQTRHKLQCIILKRAGRAVPQLQCIGIPGHMRRKACLAAEVFGAVCLLCGGF